jgi:Cellulase (glycosyl hydrolase family 5)
VRAVLLAVALAACGAVSAAAQDADFWSVTRRGANSFNRVESGEHLAAARAFGAGFVRMAFGKWQGAGRDFLAGDLDDYKGLVPADVAQLRAVLDAAAREGVPIVLTPLDLPGGRWRQNNGDAFDDRIWSDRAWWDAAARYWADIARAFKGHPALAAYNIINEPAPEVRGDAGDASSDIRARDAWCARQRGTARDLGAFYRRIVAAIRAVDATTPIILDTGDYGAPLAARCLVPLDDPHVLYAAHMYEPYEYTTQRINNGRWRYPGVISSGGRTQSWNAAAIAAELRPFVDWADAHGLARDRLMLGEFGCDRRVAGCAAYLRDVIAAAEAAHLHWAFYAFREDVWDGMDYELGDGPVPAEYWAAIGRGETPDPPRPANPMAETLRRALAVRAAAGGSRAGGDPAGLR